MSEQTGAGGWLVLYRQYRRFLQYATPDRRYFWLDAASIVVAVLTNAALIWLLGRPLSLIQAGEFDALTGVLALFAGVLLLNQAAQLGGGWLTNWLELRFIGRVRNAVLSCLLALSFPVAGNLPRGDLLARLSNDVDRVSAILVQSRLMLVSHLLTLFLYVFMLFWINVYLALVALATVPLFLLHQRFFSRRIRAAAERFLHTNGALLAFEEQAIANLRGISANCAEPQVRRRHRVVFDTALRWAVRERGLDVAFGASFMLLMYLVGLFVVLLGVDDVQRGTLPVGLFVSFILYLGYLTVPVRGLADIAFRFAANASAARRILELMEMPPAVADAPKARALHVGAGGIRIDGLWFAYPGGATVLRDAQLTVRGGETVALVGPSGSGKSTLAALLLRFHDPQRGCIRIDGQDLREVSIASLRRAIAVVWQQPFVLDDSIRANLLLARPEASDAELVLACRRSHAWEFIASMPAGLDTPLGAGGVELSGGQQQRLAIAQAFLRDAPILVLDEASSALDSRTERVIVEALDALRANRTTLLIAHRHSSIRGADRVVYFEADGSLTAGRHDELMKTHPAYRDAVEWQTATHPDE